MHYSQNNEQDVILKAFNGLVGKFLDIGAFNGRTFSNTLALVELGWSGVCVEPSPYVFPALHAEHKANARINLVMAAISPEAGKLVKWYDCGGDAISTTDLAHKQKWETGGPTKFNEFFLYTMPLAELFAAFGFGFDFINIDVEATNFALFNALPFSALQKLRVLCIEHDCHHQEMKAYAANFGFKEIGFNGENLILAR